MEALHEFTLRLDARFGSQSNPSQADLLSVADELARLCHELDFNASDLPEAMPGQEVLHDLAVSSIGGPSVYLVSDGLGVSSPPHEHKTWAVIVGIRGVELNTKFERTAVNSQQVHAIESVRVGAGRVLILSPTEIHSTNVLGEHAT